MDTSTAWRFHDSDFNQSKGPACGSSCGLSLQAPALDVRITHETLLPGAEQYPKAPWYVHALTLRARTAAILP